MLPFHSLRVLRRTIQAAKKMPKSFSETPRLMTDASNKAEMLFLSRMFYASYFCQNTFMLVFSACKMVEITLQHGISPMSGPAFASLSTIVNGILKDRKTAHDLAETALSFHKLVRSPFMESQTMFIIQAHIFCWSKPMSSLLMSNQQVYKLGCRSGNSEYAMWALYARDLLLPLHLGKKLGPIAENTAKCVPQMEELGQSAQVWMARIYWQLVLNLMGDADNVLVLEGKALNSQDYRKEFGEQDNMQNIVKGAEIELWVFYGVYQKAAKLALEFGDKDNFFGGSTGFHDFFNRCMALYTWARQTKNHRKYSKLANKVRKMIHQWAKDGNPNVKHFDCALEAEQAALDGKYDIAEKQYKEAITLAGRIGRMQHAGLFDERYADLLKNHIGNKEEAVYRLNESIRWYEEWGAVLKVKQLKDSLSLYVDDGR